MNNWKKTTDKICSNVWSVKIISDICNISRGRIISKKYISENEGAYPVYSSQTENNGELGKISTFDFEGEYLTWTTDGANAGTVFYRNGRFSVTNVCGLLKVSSNEVNIKFLYYILNKEAQKYVNSGMGNPKLMSNVMAKIKVPIPPLEVQCEIVDILDQFSEYTTELTTELTAELATRKEQYEYYLNHLFDFSRRKDVEYKLVGDLFEIKNGLNKEKDAFGKGTPIINFTDVYKNRWLTKDMFSGKVKVNSNEIERYSAKKGDVFFTRTSETKEDIGMSCTLVEDVPECVFSGFVLRARPITNLLLPKFCAYYFSTNKVRNNIVKYASFTTRATTTGPKLSKIEVPIIPMEEQQRIVDILEYFETLCNDISTCISAEIDVRKKQYEFYLDKILTF